MTKLIVKTEIKAAPEVCFDLARDIGLHCHTVRHTQERAIEGVTTGLIGLGEWVTFEAVHFGFRQRLTAKITEFDSPRCFVDEMTQGAFVSLRHVHEFIPQQGGTLMRDTLIWKSPFGAFGTILDKVFLRRYMRRFLIERNASLKRIAEGKSQVQST
jgi:ligand-binding SRPBCC domain-containing protein